MKFNKLKPTVDSYKNYFFDGGFPEFLEDKDSDYLNDLLNGVVMRDIAVRYGIKNTVILKKLVIYLISNVGKEFSYNSLKKMFDISSVRSVIDYISFFEDAYLIFTVPRFSYSSKKQQIAPNLSNTR